MLSKHYITLEPVLEEAVVWASTLSVLIVSSVGLVQPRRLWTRLLLFTFELPIKKNPLGESLLLPPGEPLQLAGDVRQECRPSVPRGTVSLRSLVYQHSSCGKEQQHRPTDKQTQLGAESQPWPSSEDFAWHSHALIWRISPKHALVIKLRAHNHVLLTPNISFLASMAQHCRQIKGALFSDLRFNTHHMEKGFMSLCLYKKRLAVEERSLSY